MFFGLLKNSKNNDDNDTTQRNSNMKTEAGRYLEGSQVWFGLVWYRQNPELGRLHHQEGTEEEVSHSPYHSRRAKAQQQWSGRSPHQEAARGKKEEASCLDGPRKGYTQHPDAEAAEKFADPRSGSCCR